MASLIQGLNIANDGKEIRGFIERMLVTFALTLVLMAGLIFGLTATLPPSPNPAGHAFTTVLALTGGYFSMILS